MSKLSFRIRERHWFLPRGGGYQENKPFTVCPSGRRYSVIYPDPGHFLRSDIHKQALPYAEIASSNGNGGITKDFSLSLAPRAIIFGFFASC